MYGAIVRNDVKTVRRLIHQDRSVLDAYFLEDSWLHRAAMLGRIDIMAVLVEAGMPVDKLTADGYRTPLDAAAGQGHYQACEWLLDQGADINHGFGMSATPLFSAIFSKSRELVELFIRRGASLDATFGRPKIDVPSYALTYGTPEITRFLEGSGAKPRGD
jgi:ankyrin repeat protein